MDTRSPGTIAPMIFGPNKMSSVSKSRPDAGSLQTRGTDELEVLQIKCIKCDSSDAAID